MIYALHIGVLSCFALKKSFLKSRQGAKASHLEAPQLQLSSQDSARTAPRPWPFTLSFAGPQLIEAPLPMSSAQGAGLSTSCAVAFAFTKGRLSRFTRRSAKLP